MARTRVIRPEFFTSPDIALLSFEAAYLFAGMLTTADDGGNQKYSPLGLKIQVFGGRKETAEDVERFLGELIKGGLIRRYKSDDDGVEYVTIVKWFKYQKPPRPTYHHPPPPGSPKEAEIRKALGLEPRNGSEPATMNNGYSLIAHGDNTARAMNDQCARTLNRKEKKGIEEKRKEDNTFCSEVSPSLASEPPLRPEIDQGRIDQPAEVARPEPPEPPPDDPIVLVYPCVPGKKPAKAEKRYEWPLRQSVVSEFRECFPSVDVMAELRAAKSWCHSNSGKRKTFDGMHAFLSRWLTQAQNRAGAPIRGPSDQSPDRHESVVDRIMRKRLAQEAATS